MKRYLLCLFLLIYSGTLRAQFCPTNIDFELGNFTNWTCDISSNTGSGLYNWTPTAPIAGRFAITSGVALDPYGNFPINSPYGGLYAVKLGNSMTGSEMERMKYVINIPPGASNYSLIYRYAVVFQDPGHPSMQQPFFRVTAYNAGNNSIITCNDNMFIAGSSLPGFIETAPNSNIWYKEWTTASLKLDGLAGQTVIIEFTSSDCSQSGHFGYGYIDMSCGLYAITSANCNGSTTTPLVAPPGFMSYTWYDSAYTVNLGTGQTITIPTPTTTKYFNVVLQPYPNYGCVDTLTTKVVFSTLSVNATPDTAGLCTIGSVQLNTTQTGSAPPFTYVWTPTPGLSCAYCPNPIASPTVNTTYTVAVTDSIGCTIRDTVRVTAGITLTSSVVNASCATAQNGSANVYVAGGTAPYTYSWNSTPIQTTSSLTGVLPGTYTCTVTDNTNCVATRTVTIGITPITLNETHNNVFCATATNGQATVSPVGGTAPYTYSWNTSPVQTTATASGLAPGTYVCTVTDVWGCTASKSVTIVVVPFTLSTSHINVSCNGLSNGSATVIIPAGPLGPFTYSWNTTPVQTTATASLLPTGTYTVTVTSGTCISTATATISQPAALNLTTSGVNLYCRSLANGSVTVSVTGGTAPYTYSWNSIPVQTTATATGLIDGTYTCTVTDAHGCIANATQILLATAPLTVHASIVARSCNGGNNNILTATPTGGSGSIAYEWNSIPAQYTQTATNLPSGYYRVIVTDAVGCTARDSLSVFSFAPTVVTASKDVEICAGQTAALTVSGGISYTWIPGTGLSCTTCTSPIASPVVTTTYLVIGKDANNCSDTDEVKVVVIERTNVSVDSSRTICAGDKVMLNASGGASYQWTPEETLQGSFLPNPIATPVKTTTYQVIITENRCFSDTLTETITVLPLPTVDAGNGFSGIPGAVVQLGASATNANTITWMPPKGLSCYDCYNPVATLNETIIYVVEVTDTFGCKARDTIRITVGCNPDAFFMANTFTPNNDGKNDYFYPQALGINTISRFMIYNRWGQTVFSATNIPANVPERGWNGIYLGKELAPDVFVFAIEAICSDGQPIVLKGDVTLVR